jgi:hypothetical protein
VNEFLLELIQILKDGESMTEHGDRVEPGYSLMANLDILADKIKNATLETKVWQCPTCDQVIDESHVCTHQL